MTERSSKEPRDQEIAKSLGLTIGIVRQKKDLALRKLRNISNIQTLEQDL